MSLSATRVTELASPLTQGLELLDAAGALRCLCANDALLFAGYGGLPGLLDAATLDSAAGLCASMRAALAHPAGHVVFAGCGTSGRLAHFHATSLNAAWAAGGGGARAQPPFSYILAGGDAALVLPQEAAEDSPSAALAALAAWEARHCPAPHAPIVLLGVTCGLSAPFVFALLEAALGKPPGGAEWTPAVLGFNPIGAMAAPLPAAHATLLRMQAAAEAGAASDAAGGAPAPARRRAHVLTPCLGPEAVAGSSRMKGGSATSVLLQALAAVALAPPLPAAPPLAAQLQEALLRFSDALQRLYAAASAGSDSGSSGGLAPLAAAAGAALTSASAASPTRRGRLIYLGAGAAGALALTDASECPPTFGSLHDDVRGYVAGGFAALLGAEAAAALPPLRIPPQLLLPPAPAPAPAAPAAPAEPDAPPRLAVVDLEAGFAGECLPTLGPSDCVILVAIEGVGSSEEQAGALRALAAAGARGAVLGHICVLSSSGSAGGRALAAAARAAAPLGLALALPELALRPAALPATASLPCLAFLALKLALNAVSTLAHAARGCVVRGRMVAMCISNSKLYHRAVGIIEDVAGVARGAAERALLAAIYEGQREAAGGGRGARPAAPAAPPWTRTCAQPRGSRACCQWPSCWQPALRWAAAAAARKSAARCCAGSQCPAGPLQRCAPRRQRRQRADSAGERGEGFLFLLPVFAS